MAANIELIQKLRAQTGAGIVDCKKALEDHQGDFDSALDELRKKGLAKIAKRAERETSQGFIQIAISDDGHTAWMLEANAETDFVVRNEKFQTFSKQVFELAREKKPLDREALLNTSFDGGTVKSALDELSSVIGEKLDLKNYALVSGSGTLAVYSHLGGKIGAIVALNQPGLEAAAYDVAMQVAAQNPSYLKPEDIPAEVIAKEKDIYAEQLKNEGKPEAMLEKILGGKMQKYYQEVCLLNQAFIKDDKLTIEQYLRQTAGENVSVEKFVRFSLA